MGPLTMSSRELCFFWLGYSAYALPTPLQCLPAPGSFVLICLRTPTLANSVLMLRAQPASLVAGFVMFCLHGLCGDGQFGLSLISVAMYSLHLVDHTGGSSFRFITQAAGTRRKQNDTTKDPPPRATATEFLLMTRNTQIKISYYHLHRCEVDHQDNRICKQLRQHRGSRDASATPMDVQYATLFSRPWTGKNVTEAWDAGNKVGKKTPEPTASPTARRKRRKRKGKSERA